MDLAGRRVRGSAAMHFGRLQDQVQGFLLLRRANLSTEAPIAIMTLAGNSLSFGDVRKACKRYAGEFLRDPKEHDARGPHTVHVSQTKEASVTAEEQGRDADVESPLRPWQGKATLIWKKPMSRRYCWLTKNRDSYGENSG